MKKADEGLISHVFEAVDDPYRLARVISQENPDLKHWRAEWYRFDEYRYIRLSKEDLKAIATRVIKGEFDNSFFSQLRSQHGQTGGNGAANKVPRTLVQNVLQALESECNLPADRRQPSWIGAKEPFPPKECLATRTAIVHVPTLKTTKVTPDFFTTIAVDFDYDKKAKCPRWRKFLK